MAIILVVDDDPIVLTVIREFLEVLEHSVLSATSCMEVETMLQNTQQHIDLMVTDYHLPDGTGMSNIELVKKCRHNARTLMISADFRVEEQIGKEVKFLYKPFRLAKLKQAVETLLSLEPA